MFVHLTKGTFHCLPDDYEINDPSLNDISAALHPTFTANDIANIDSNTGLARDLFGRRYLPGYVGLNNLNKTDCVNATIQALAHVKPLRDFFLQRSHKDIMIEIPSKSSGKRKPPHRMSHLAQCFGELVRKMWSDKRFKSHVDPHMLIQAITVDSKKKFQVGKQAEAGEFMSWLLNQLHIGLGGSRKPGSSVIYKAFQGKLQVTTRQRKVVEQAKQESTEENGTKEDGDEVMKESEGDKVPEEPIVEETTTDTTFLQLTLDIPEKALFRDEDGGLVIPQEPLVNVLRKFDGISFSDALSRSGAAQRKRYRLLQLPQYLILHLSRFKTNRYTREKNPTIVAFPIKNLDLGKYVYHENGKESSPTEDEVRSMDVSTCILHIL